MKGPWSAGGIQSCIDVFATITGTAGAWHSAFWLVSFNSVCQSLLPKARALGGECMETILSLFLWSRRAYGTLMQGSGRGWVTLIRRKIEGDGKTVYNVLKTSARSSETDINPFYSRATQRQANLTPGYKHLCVDPGRAGEPFLAGVWCRQWGWYAATKTERCHRHQGMWCFHPQVHLSNFVADLYKHFRCSQESCSRLERSLIVFSEEYTQLRSQ